jgi:hypothetical protein
MIYAVEISSLAARQIKKLSQTSNNRYWPSWHYFIVPALKRRNIAQDAPASLNQASGKRGAGAPFHRSHAGAWERWNFAYIDRLQLCAEPLSCC